MMRQNAAVPVKVWALFCVTLGVSLSRDPALTFLFALTGFVYLAVQKNFSFLLKALVFYGILALLLYLIRFHGLHMKLFSEFYVLMFWNLFPVCLVGWDLLTTHPGELAAFFAKFHLPASFILGLLVMFRFFPTMKSEVGSVAISMKNRGLTRPSQLFLHPFLSFEYVYVPCLLRCVQLADTLSVSAVARGAQCPGKRGSYYGKGIGAKDRFLALLWLLVTLSFFYGGGGFS